MNRISHWIDGAIVEGSSGRSGTVFNPATGEQAASVDFANDAEVDAAVAAGEAAPSRAGGRPSLGRRAEVMFHIRELVDANRKEIASLLTAEHGKVLSDALGEVARGLENIEFACGIPHLLKGGYSEQAATGVDVYSIRQPLGVVAGITPFNFPAMVPMWMFANALACGNTFVLKPSEKDPSASLLMAELLAKAGLAARLLQRRAGRQGGRRPAPRAPRHRGDQLRRLDADRPLHLRDRHAERQAGAGARRGEEPHARAARRRPRHGRRRRRVGRLRVGRASAAWRSASSSPSTSIADELVDKIAQRIPSLKVGPGTEPDNEMGPLITGEHRDRVAGYVDGAERRGRDRRRRRARGAPSDGFFLNPSLLDHVAPGHAGLRRRDLRAGAVRGPGRTPTTRASSSSTTTRTATARRSSPATAAPPASSSST